MVPDVDSPVNKRWNAGWVDIVNALNNINITLYCRLGIIQLILELQFIRNIFILLYVLHNKKTNNNNIIIIINYSVFNEKIS